MRCEHKIFRMVTKLQYVEFSLKRLMLSLMNSFVLKLIILTLEEKALEHLIKKQCRVCIVLLCVLMQIKTKSQLLYSKSYTEMDSFHLGFIFIYKRIL